MSGLTANERDYLRKRGIIVLPGARDVGVQESDRSIRVEYKIDVVGPTQGLYDAVKDSVIEMGWVIKETTDWKRISAASPNSPIVVMYYFSGITRNHKPSSGHLSVGAISVETSRPTPTPTSRPRPIS